MEKNKKPKYSLPFVNDGKPFELEKWTVRKHKDVLKKASEFEEKHPKATEEEKDEFYQNTLILRGLRDIDSSVRASDLDELHPADKTALFAAIYYQGRDGILYEEKGDAVNFRKPKAKKTK